MYFRTLQNIINISTKLKNHKSLKKINTILPTLAVQRLLPFVNNQCCIRPFSSDEYEALEKDPVLRKKKIDDEAQRQIDALIAKKPELEKFIKVLELELTVKQQDNERVPSELRPRDWLELIQLDSYNKRKKFLDYLFIIEKQREKAKQEKMEKQLKLEKKEIVDNGEIVYGIGRNHMLRRIVEPTMNKLWNWNSLKAIMYGNKLVFDCGYEKYMSPQEIKSCAKQLMVSYSANRMHNHPFEIFLCNLDMSGALLQKLTAYIPTLFDKDFPMTVTTKSYLDLFEKSQLVYLTSNCQETLEEYDPYSTYIIGAFVDKGAKRPISLGKAKQENIRMAKLPIDKYLNFGDGSGKDLTLNQVCSIMLDAQCCSWKEALKHVPTRKLYDSRIHALERKVQSDLFKLRNDFKTENDKEKIIPSFESAEVHDFSHAARVKLRQQWNKR